MRKSTLTEPMNQARDKISPYIHTYITQRFHLRKEYSNSTCEQSRNENL